MKFEICLQKNQPIKIKEPLYKKTCNFDNKKILIRKIARCLNKSGDDWQCDGDWQSGDDWQSDGD